MLSLVMNPGLPEEQSFPLPLGKATIGRTKDNDISCFHKSLSRRHAELDSDGTRVRLTDLQSKNGVFVRGRRIARCDLVDGDTFRCGDVTFLVEGATTRNPKVSNAAQTLPSPLAADLLRTKASAGSPEEDAGLKDKLFALVRATELIVSDMPLEAMLEELVVLAAQVLEIDRIALLTLDDVTLELYPRAVKTFAGADARPYSQRVVDWVTDHGSASAFADVSSDHTLPGDPAPDARIRGAMCVPINPGGGLIGVLYADNVTRAGGFRPDEVALFRALANLAALALEAEVLRHPPSDRTLMSD